MDEGCCVICPFGKCTKKECIFVDVFPAKEPFTDQSVLTAQKIFSMGFKMEYIKNTLITCKKWGGLKLMEECVRGWVMEYDFKDIDKKHAMSVTYRVNRIIFKLISKKLDKYTKIYGVPEDSKLKHLDPALVKWYKKRHCPEDGSSSDDSAVDPKRVKFFHDLLD